MTDVLDQDLLLAKLRRLQLARQRAALASNDPLLFYKPSPKQDAFHRAFQFRRRMVRAGNRFGKTTTGCAEDSSWLRGERPWLPASDPARIGGIPQRPIRGLVVTTNWDKVDEVWTSQRGNEGKIWRMLPRDGFVKSAPRNHVGVIDTIECQNGSVLRFYTVKAWLSDPQSAESVDWDFIHVDEPCPKGLWDGVSRGLLDRGGHAWFTLTPLSEPWISDFFFPQDTGGQMRDDVWAIDASTYDNPYLNPADIKEYEASLNEDERQCRIHGLPLHLAGLVYKEFSWDEHVLKDLPIGWTAFDKPPSSWPIYVAIDPHPQLPHAVLFCAVSPFGHRYYFLDIFQRSSIRELVTGRSARPEAPSNLQGILPSLGNRRPVWTKMDPLGFQEVPETGECLADEAFKSGLPVEKATKALAAGIIKVQQELKQRDCTGRPVIHFTPSARRTLWEIRRYSWDEKANKPVDCDDHMMENLYRIEMSSPRWIDMSANKSEPTPELEIVRPELELETLNFNETYDL